MPNPENIVWVRGTISLYSDKHKLLKSLRYYTTKGRSELMEKWRRWCREHKIENAYFKITISNAEINRQEDKDRNSKIF